MLRRNLLIAGFIVALGNMAVSLDTKPFVGTWEGKLGGGSTVRLTIPAKIGEGAPANYWFGGKKQAPQTPSVAGDKIRLDNPGPSYILIGPVKGNQMTFFWTDGKNRASAVLAKR